MKINGLLLIAFLQISQFALAQQVEVIAEPTVTKRVLKLEADVADVESSSTVVVTNIRLVDASDSKKISYFHPRATKETKNMTTGEYTLIENTSNYICNQLGYGNTVPQSTKKSDKIYLMMGEFIATSLDASNLVLEAAGKSFDNALASTTCTRR